MTTCLGKSCSFCLPCVPSLYVFSYFTLGFEGRMWDLIVSVPDHCLSFYFSSKSELCKEVKSICQLKSAEYTQPGPTTVIVDGVGSQIADIKNSVSYRYTDLAINFCFMLAYWLLEVLIQESCWSWLYLSVLGLVAHSLSPVKRICVFKHSVMTNSNCACPAIQRGQGSGFLSEGSSWLTACMSEQRRFWRDCANAQAHLNLRCSHRR